MAEAHKRKRHPKYRKKYKVRNWSEYDRSLRSRGDLTIWLSEDVIDAWGPEQNGKRGRQRKYSDISIELALSLRIESNGVYNWRRASDYYRQSTVENTFYRYKQIIGDELKARDEDSRQVESILACNILNLLRVTGRAESELVQ